jgi:hypothetical protein
MLIENFLAHADGHGLVTVSESLKLDLQLPETVRSTYRPDHGTYLIGVFHQIHCLVSSAAAVVRICRSSQESFI